MARLRALTANFARAAGVNVERARLDIAMYNRRVL
jgi:hypothetical protein